MASVYARGNIKKIILLILLIIILLFSGILIVDFVGTMFGVYFPLPGLKLIKSVTIKKKLIQAEDPFLLEREELSKDKDRLSILEEQIMVREKEIEQKEVESQKKLDILKDKEKELIKRAKLLDDKDQQSKDKKKNLHEQAIKLYNMPPKDAVSILEKQAETDIVDILREIDAYSDEIGRQSISPFYLKLLGDINKEKAANVLRKIKYPNSNEGTAVDVLKDEEMDEALKP